MAVVERDVEAAEDVHLADERFTQAIGWRAEHVRDDAVRALDPRGERAVMAGVDLLERLGGEGLCREHVVLPDPAMLGHDRHHALGGLGGLRRGASTQETG